MAVMRKQKANRSIKSWKHKNQRQSRTTKRDSNLFNHFKRGPTRFKKNFQQSETLNEHNYSQKKRILPTKQNISTKKQPQWKEYNNKPTLYN